MDIVRLSSRRAGTLFAAGILLFATMLPALASAATITTRSIELTSSVIDETNVTYNVLFTAETDGTDSFVVDFCTTAAIDTTCTAPSGLVATAAGNTVSGDTVSDLDANTVQVDLASTADDGDPVEVDITGMVNPDTAGVFYARIVTYDDTVDAATYTSDDIDNGGLNEHFDNGSVALSATDGFEVGGSVLETLTFCASGSAIPDDCVTVDADVDLSLGVAGVLGTTASTGTVYTKLSTNAQGGAVVSLKSDTTDCGGLVRQGSSSNAEGCGITPIATPAAAIGDNASEFGMLLALTGVTVGASWSTTNYDMDYVAGNATGVTSPYGSEIYNTAGDPVSEGTGNLTFGANISNTTPAGRYSAQMNLIATGTF